MEPVVERRQQGWEIREKDQFPGTGTIVTDNWLALHGFGVPTRFNIDRIIQATIASYHGYAIEKVDHRELLTPEMTRTQFYIPGGTK